MILYPVAIKRQKAATQGLHSLQSSAPIKTYDIKKENVDTELCSIIIPAHNEEKVIKQTIMSCLQQSYKNIEIVVVCHNCTDGTYKEGKQLEDDRVHVFEYKTEDSGKGIALNYGVSMSKGKYLMILDGDGRLNNTFIEDALPMFHVGNYAAVQGRYIPSNRGYNFLTRMLAIEGDLWSTPFMTVRGTKNGRTPLGGTGYIIKKDILLDVGGFANHLVDDYELTFRLLRKKYRIAFAPLSINYDEKPPSLNMMFNQRGRWLKGFFNLLKFRVSEPGDIIGNLYWVNPISGFTNLALLIISAFSTVFYFGFHYFPFHFAYISPTLWIDLMASMLVLNTLVLVRVYGKQGLRYAVLLPIYLLFSNYYLVVSFKAFFIKSWATSKTDHGFMDDKTARSISNSGRTQPVAY